MTQEPVDQMRQRMQVIISAADNIRTRLAQLHVHDVDITESVSALERNVEQLNQQITAFVKPKQRKPR